MHTLFILAVLSFSINSIWTATPFKDCGSKLGAIISFQVTGCDAAPCKLIKGTICSMNLTFQAKTASKTASIIIHGVIGGVPIPFPLPDPDGCKLGVKCPVSENDTNVVSLAFPVQSSYPSISLYVKIEVQADDQKEDYVCVLFPAKITSSLADEQRRVGWQRGKLFEMLS